MPPSPEGHCPSCDSTSPDHGDHPSRRPAPNRAASKTRESSRRWCQDGVPVRRWQQPEVVADADAVEAMVVDESQRHGEAVLIRRLESVRATRPMPLPGKGIVVPTFHRLP